MRTALRRMLVTAVVSSLLLPAVLAILLGLGALLQSLGDDAGAAFCGRVNLALGVLWLSAVIATAIASGMLVLATEGGARRPLRDRRSPVERAPGDLPGAPRGAGDVHGD